MSRKLALLIGNSHYDDPSLAQLVAPGKDAHNLAEVLRNPDIGGFTEVTTLANEFLAHIQPAIADFFAEKKPDDLLLLYFSGHGVLDERGRLYLAIKNTRRVRLTGTALPAAFLTDEMDNSRSRRQVLILDCCHSGAFGRGTKAATGAKAVTQATFEGLGYGRTVLTATDATQYAWEGDQVLGEGENSVFTRFLVEGLRSGAADTDGDGRITLDEWYDYVYDQIVAQTPKQTPGKWTYKQQGGIVIARNPAPAEKAELTLELQETINDRRPWVREGAVRELDRLLKGSHQGRVLAAQEALKQLVERDDSFQVRAAATAALTEYAEARRVKDEARARPEAVAEEQAQEVAKDQAEAERIARENAEAERQEPAKTEAERRARERAEGQYREAQKAEARRKAQEEAERHAREREARERQEQLERERVAAERLAKEIPERLAAQKAESEHQRQAQAEQQQFVPEEANGRRLGLGKHLRRSTLAWTVLSTLMVCLVGLLLYWVFKTSAASYLGLATESVSTTRTAAALVTQGVVNEAPTDFSGTATTPESFSATRTAAAPATQGVVNDAPTDFSGTATIAFVQEPDSLSPLYTSMFFSSLTRDLWLKGLWSFDENHRPVPEIAAEVPSIENGGLSEDGQTIQVGLRHDVTWSDGTLLTAGDFEFTFDMVMSNQNAVQSRYPYEDYVDSVEAVDDFTLNIYLKEPFAAWLTTLFNYVLPKHILQPVFDEEGTLDNAEWNNAPTVGVGPFVFQEWESGYQMIFTGNRNWIRPPQLEQIFIRIVPDDAAQEAAIIAGDADIGVFLSSDQTEALEAGGTVDVVAVSSGYNEAWFLNLNPETAHPAMLDVNVRKAIALATDRFTVVEELLDEAINPVNVTFWDGTPPYGPHPDLQPYPYDPEAAMALLDEAGWVDSNGNGTRDKGGTELVLRYITNERELRKNVQAMVQQQWAQVGIGAELVNYPSDVFWNGFNDGGPQAQGQYDIAEYTSVGRFADPEASTYWLCDQISSATNPNGANWQGYCNPELDGLLKQQAVTLDQAERIQLYRQIEEILYNDVIYIGLWRDPDLWSVNNRLQGVRLSGASPFWNAHEWTVGQ